MMYAILDKRQQRADRRAVDTPGVLLVDVSRLTANVDALTGRGYAIQVPSVRRRLHERGSVYIAAKRGPGIIIESVR